MALLTTQHYVVSLFFIVEVDMLQVNTSLEIKMKVDFELRRKRNAFLRESDWTQFNDSPLNAMQKESWAKYRQLLRDLPDNCSPSFDDTGNLIGANFPEKPAFE